MLTSATLLAQEAKTDTTALPPVEVRALRAGRKAPFTKTDLGREQIEKANLGQDLPFLLNSTPSTVVSSDAGNGVGYTGLRIRGSDLTRINVTLNGIPYNDPESQAVFFVDLPDFASSVSSLQIQRGVGTSSNGAGAFGASLNLSTNEVNATPYVQLLNSFGSFATRRHTLKAGTGLLKEHFTFDARLSAISSEGFIDRASADLRSYFVSGAWIGGRSSVRVNIFSGKEKTYQAWNGIPEYKLFYNADSLLTHYYNNLGSLYFTAADSANLFNTANNRRYNGYLYPNQTDNYQQDHYQAFFDHRFGAHTTLGIAFFLTQGSGYYEQYRYNDKFSSYGLANPVIGGSALTRTDLVRQLWLDNDYYGTTFSLERKGVRADLTLGGSLSRFKGEHFGTVIWSAQGFPKDYTWYRFPAKKDDGNLFAKLGYRLNAQWHALADLQFRYVEHRLNGTRKFPALSGRYDYKFFNPKAGLYYEGKGFNAYFSYAMANKEPNRTDFETSQPAQVPKPEQLHDLEAGIEHRGSTSRYGATLFYMLYRDQLVLTGELNDVGDAVRVNVPNSYRAGIELSGGMQLAPWLRAEGNFTYSENKIRSYTDYIARYDAAFDFMGYDSLHLSNTDIGFSPKITAFLRLAATPVKGLEIGLNSKAVSKQYLDNTQSDNRSLNGYFVQDLQLRYAFTARKTANVELVFAVNNLWNRHYESNGYTYSYYYAQSLVRENFYYPMAGVNWMAGLNVKL